MTTAALLTIVATLLVRHHVPVYCTHPTGIPWYDNDGYATWPPDRIYLRRCLGTIQLKSEAVVAFAHELIHIEHHNWNHSKVYSLDNWYASHVVRRTIIRVKEQQLESSKGGD